MIAGLVWRDGTMITVNFAGTNLWKIRQREVKTALNRDIAAVMVSIGFVRCAFMIFRNDFILNW